MKDRNMSANEAKRNWERLRDYSIWNLVNVKDGKIVAKNEANKGYYRPIHTCIVQQGQEYGADMRRRP